MRIKIISTTVPLKWQQPMSPMDPYKPEFIVSQSNHRTSKTLQLKKKKENAKIPTQWKMIHVCHNNSTYWPQNFGFIPSTCSIIIQCVQKVTVHLQKVLEVMSMSVYTGLNLFNFTSKHFPQICVCKVTVHLQKVLQVMPMSNFDTDNQICIP
jgi:hypothetical protein